MRDRFTTVTGHVLDDDPKAAVVLADIGVSRFVQDGIVNRHPERIVNVGIREQLMIGVAAGMALEGFRPIVHSITPFLVERPFEQIKLDLGHQDLGAVLVSVGASHDYADNGRTHQAPADVALLATLPGWTIHVPGHPDEVEAALRSAMAETGRVYLRLAEAKNRKPHPDAVGDTIVVRDRDPNAPVVIAVGPMLDRVLQATAELDVTVMYTASVLPFACDALHSRSAADFVVVEPMLEGTSVPALSDALSDRPHRLLGIGVGRKDLRRYGTPEEHDRAHGLDATGIRRRIEAFLDTRVIG